MTDADRLAVALADAMLAGPWDFAAMRDRGRLVIDRRAGWLTALVREVLITYPRPPADRPRELAEYVLHANGFAEGARQTGQRLPKPAHRLTEPARTVARPFLTPVLDNAAALATQLGIDTDDLALFADTRLRARRASSSRIPHYLYRWLDHRSGPRLLEAPRPRMAALQRQILDDILQPIPPHPAAHGYVVGRSAITNASVHAGATVVLSFDLEHFFASITAGRIWGVLRSAGYPEPVAHLLTGLTTHATPVSALRDMPPLPLGVNPSRAFRLRRRLAVPHLPQGAPTSPQLANLVAFSLDRRLHAYARAAGFTYTRYADDLSFSAGPKSGAQLAALQSAVEKIVSSSGFALNAGKTRVRHRSQRQLVTGIVVNEYPNLTRPDFDRLKAILHDCARNGPRAANRTGHPQFQEHLLGRISWATALNPTRGGRLRALFDAIEWGASEP